MAEMTSLSKELNKYHSQLWINLKTIYIRQSSTIAIGWLELFHIMTISFGQADISLKSLILNSFNGFEKPSDI